MIKDLTFLDFLTVSAIVEVLVLVYFRFTRGIINKSSAINRWYDNLRWSAIVLDILSFLGGFYIAKFIYEYLVNNKYITNKNELYKYLGLVLLVQITHDFLFYFLIINPYPKNTNKVMDEFKYYASRAGTNAVIGDSIMYLIGTTLLYYVIQNNNKDTNIFISILSFYLIGYLVYQKPL